jgi:mono/diheme cytochrome c family protein
MIRLIVLLLAGSLIAGCTRSNMDSLPKYHEYEPGRLFRDGKVLQSPVPGTVARGDLARAAEARERPAMNAELLAHGRIQYDVFCSPCHDRTGTGHGIVIQRGFPQPENFHDDKLRAADDQHYFDVITDGYGAMYAHRDRIRPHDRWAIVAYIRALQLSQHASLTDVPPDEQVRLTQDGGR